MKPSINYYRLKVLIENLCYIQKTNLKLHKVSNLLAEDVISLSHSDGKHCYEVTLIYTL